MDQAILLKATKKQEEKNKRNVINWIQTEKGNIKSSSPTNVALFIESQSVFDGLFKFNKFTGTVELTKSIYKDKLNIDRNENEGSLYDEVNAEIRMYAERIMNITFTKDATDDGIQKIARDHSYNPILDYMNEAYKEWDKRPRLQHVFHDFLGVEENEATDLITRLFFVGGVAKAYNPKTKFDFVLDLVGSQGTGKTEFLKRLTPLGYYTDQFTSFSDKDDIATMARNFIVNDDELTATKKTSFEELKKFISLTELSFRPPYGRSNVYKSKGFIIARTTNELYYLKDKTGDRRFLPIRCHHNHRNIFTEFTDEYVKQLWGEAVNLYKSKTVDISAHSDEENELLNNQRDHFKYVDSVEEKIDELMENKFNNRDFIPSSDIRHAIDPYSSPRDRKLSNQIMNIMVNKYHFKANQVKRTKEKVLKGYLKVT